MNYVTTNIRLTEEIYLQLKKEAAEKRKSLSAVIREKLAGDKDYSGTQVEKLLQDLHKLAKKQSKKLKHFDSLKALREIRDEAE